MPLDSRTDASLHQALEPWDKFKSRIRPLICNALISCLVLRLLNIRSCCCALPSSFAASISYYFFWWWITLDDFWLCFSFFVVSLCSFHILHFCSFYMYIILTFFFHITFIPIRDFDEVLVYNVLKYFLIFMKKNDSFNILTLSVQKCCSHTKIWPDPLFFKNYKHLKKFLNSILSFLNSFEILKFIKLKLKFKNLNFLKLFFQILNISWFCTLHITGILIRFAVPSINWGTCLRMNGVHWKWRKSFFM